MNKEELLKIGFEEMPHRTVGNVLVYRLSRERHLSIGSLGTPNEILYLCATETIDNKESITDLICLHNYDYDGYINMEKIKRIIEIF